METSDASEGTVPPPGRVTGVLASLLRKAAMAAAVVSIVPTAAVCRMMSAAISEALDMVTYL